MKVVILCGGMGTRLREETEYRPKPLVNVGGKPILWHIMKTYSAYGFHDFVLCLGYKGEMIKDYFINYDLLNSDFTISLGTKQVVKHNVVHDEAKWNVSLVDTGEKTQTAGRLARIRKYIGNDEDFFMTYGDGVSDVNVAELLRFHQDSGRLATLTGVHPVGRFGELTVQDTAVRRFAEKPLGDEVWINGGYFVLNRRVFDYLEGDQCSFEGPPLERLSGEGQLGVYRHPGFWQCMDTLRDMDQLNQIWTAGKAPWNIWNDQNDENEQPRLRAVA
jgi:glucose-1-phosphate cytidylyltransferase